MNKMSVLTRKVTVLLLSSIAVCILSIALLWFLIDVEPVRTPYLNIPDLPSAQSQSVSHVETVLARPLFWYGRRPGNAPEQIDEGTKSAVSQLREVKLLGIILTGRVRTALLEAEGKVSSMQVGQVIQGWSVDKITTKEVVFIDGTAETTLSLVRERPDSITLELTK